MPRVLDLSSKKKKKRFSLKTTIVIVVSVILTTVGIKASDMIFNGDERQANVKGECPVNMILVPSDAGGFCLDKYEASSGKGCTYQEIDSVMQTRVNLTDDGCQPESKEGVTPWRFISQDQAALACAKAGKRLPTNNEWLQAALGTPDQADGWGGNDCQVNSNWPDQPGLTGSGKNCVSSGGAYDMIGNVWEWVVGAVTDGVFNGQTLPASGYVKSTDGNSLPGITDPNMPDIDHNNDYLWVKANGLRGIARGGYWGNKADAGYYSSYIVTAPSSAEPGIGFRCAK